MNYLIRSDDISVLPLSVRSINCMRRNGIHTLGAMLDYPKDQWIEIRNMGSKSVEEILSWITVLTEGTQDFCLVSYRKEKSEPKKEKSAVKAVAFRDENGILVKDIPISALPLSVRATHVLTDNHIQFASQLAEMKIEDLLALKNMGRKSAEEVLTLVAQIQVQDNVALETQKQMKGAELAAEMVAKLGRTESFWLREIQQVYEAFPEAISETLICRLYDRQLVRDAVKESILRLLEENEDNITRTALTDQFPSHLKNTTVLEELLLEMERSGLLSAGETHIKRTYPSVISFVSQLKNERIRDILQNRLTGITLEESGLRYEISRERVRQLEKKALSKRPRLREDQYRYLYDQYDFSEEDFSRAFDEPKETYYYLEITASQSHKNRKPLEEILTDEKISVDLRKKAEKAIYKQYIVADGVRLKRTRPEMVKYYVRSRCKHLTKFDDFLEGYHIWLNEFQLGEDRTLILDSGSYKNHLNTADYVLWNQWSSFRYYNIAERDFTDLLTRLDLEQYENMQISTLKLFRDYTELMEQYDIRDEYELHNLLKKIWPEDDQTITFKKMPTIEIGTADIDEQLLSLLFQYAPISLNELAEKYEEQYGVKASSAMANYFPKIDTYLYNGMYSIEATDLPKEQFDHMKETLSKELYSIAEVKRLYLREFPNENARNINPYSLKALGFRVYSSCSGTVLKDTYSGLTNYFSALLTKDDIVDMTQCEKVILNNTTYTNVQYSLRRNYEIVEFSPRQFINIRRLNGLGIAKEQLSAYCQTVAAYYDKGDFFTIASLRQDGFVHELDELGFEDWFYSSILLEDREHFSYQRVGEKTSVTRLFRRGKCNIVMGDFFCWLVGKYQKIDFYDLMDLLRERFGILISREKILETIRCTELYYDSIMDTIYVDYDAYFEEV